MRFRSWLVVAAVLAAACLAAPLPAAAGSAAGPGIAGISPLAGPPSGGNVLTIQGTSLDRVTAVSFGGVRSRQITHTSAGRISVVVPAHPIGSVRVRLVVNGVANAGSAYYRFAPPPTQLNWSRDRTIDPEIGDLAGLSCPTRRFCASVDASFTAPALLTFAPYGRAHRSALPRNAGLPGVSCVSASLCFAMLNGAASRWNGQRWSAFRQIAPKRAALGMLSCVTGSAPFCLSVAGSGATWVHRAAGWSRTARVPRTAYNAKFSCATIHFCMLVAGDHAFRFDGTLWHAASRGLAPTLQYADPAISCVGPRFCLLVGEGETYRWTGTGWQFTPDGFARYGDALDCASTSLCILAHDDGTLAKWQAGRWQDLHPLAHPVSFPGVSCPDSRECLVTIWSGVAVRRPGGWSSHYIEPSGGDLRDVSCTAMSWCMAVDSHGNAVKRSGTRWGPVRAIDHRRALSAVSCVRDRFCVAVDGADPYDQTASAGTGHAVVYRNGRWQAPVLIDSEHGLTDVACASDSMCIAVDDGGNAVRWDGHRWSAPRHAGELLEAVACPSRTRCIAVGRHSAVWHGGYWRAIANPARSPMLTDVTCSDAHYCTVGGAGGFFVRHLGVWSTAIRPGRYLWQVQVACMSRSACFGSQDNQVDVWDYAFDGARVTWASDQLYGPKMSCTPDGCAGVSLDYAILGRPRS